MRKHAQNKIIDAILFISVIVLALTGVIMYWVLPPGSRNEVFMGFTRHDWGDLHFWVAIVFTATLIIHLFLHFAWITNTYLPNKKG